MNSRSSTATGWNFDNSYGRLPESYFVRIDPVRVRDPQVVILNTALADALGMHLNFQTPAQAAQVFSGNLIPAGAEPLAQAYAGHQYGHFVMLGDGRAVLLGEQLTPAGQRFDIQLKGSGQTPYSRQGDGRAALGPMLREYVISEAMHALGIPTTRSLAVVSTGQPVFRESTRMGGILTRVAASHIRVGTFEYAAGLENQLDLKALADYTIARHFPEVNDSDHPYLGFLQAVIDRQASLIARWMHVGFVHGVMNTDNMAISGETIDYGPCAFMNSYDPGTVFSSIDRHGRYAFGNQPNIAQWNLARFAEALLPLLAPNQEQAVSVAKDSLQTFTALFQQYWLSGMRKKLGLASEAPDDPLLVTELLQWMQRTRADYTNTFRGLASEQTSEKIAHQDEEFRQWYRRWQQRRERDGISGAASAILVRTNNPAIIPRNHLVEAVLASVAEESNMSLFSRLLSALQHPFEDREEFADYQVVPVACDEGYQTFCGT